MSLEESAPAAGHGGEGESTTAPRSLPPPRGEVNPLHAAAQAYAERGWSVLPCVPGGKEPDGALAPHGFKDATTEPATICCWRERP